MMMMDHVITTKPPLQRMTMVSNRNRNPTTSPRTEPPTKTKYYDPRYSGDLRFCVTGGRMSNKTGVITLSWVVIIDPWSYGETLPP
jgi:hypothetical protein